MIRVCSIALVMAAVGCSDGADGADGADGSADDCNADNCQAADPIEPYGDCETTDDCRPEWVCDQTVGRCAQCIVDEHCAQTELCERHRCLKRCGSDQECAPLGKHCDQDLGACVSCTSHSQCDKGMYCEMSECVPDVCAAGTWHCIDSQFVSQCNDVGNGEAQIESCPDGTRCFEEEDGPACIVDAACSPGSTRCLGSVVMRCADDGSRLTPKMDCVRLRLICVGGGCVEAEP